MLTRYEKTRVISARALQVSMGAPILTDTDKERSIDIAREEFESGVLPISVVRKYPNGEEEVANA